MKRLLALLLCFALVVAQAGPIVVNGPVLYAAAGGGGTVTFESAAEIIDIDQNNSVTITVPASLAAGNIWLITLTCDMDPGGSISTTLTGFTAIGTNIVGADNTYPVTQMWYKVAGGSESNATITPTGVDYDCVGYSVRISGTGTLSLDATGTPAAPAGSATTIDAPDITIAQNNSLAVLYAAVVGQPTMATFTAPSGSTLRDSRFGNNVYPSMGIATQAVSAGSFAPSTWGFSSTDNRTAQTVSFKSS